MQEFEVNGVEEKAETGLSRPLLIQGGLLFALLLALYFPEIKDLIYHWSDKKEYSHGFLIPLISGYVVWTKRRELGMVAADPDIKGIFLLMVGITLLIVGKVAFEPYVRQLSLVVTIMGILYANLGREAMKLLLFPVGYLMFMIPIPYIVMNAVAVSLRLVDAKVTYNALHLLGIPILRDRVTLELPNISLVVADLCTGILSIVAILALAVLYAYMSFRTNIARIALVLVAVPVSIISNMFRLIVTVGLAYFYGEVVLRGVIHEFHGTVNFLVTVVLLVLCGHIVRKIDLRIAGQKNI